MRAVGGECVGQGFCTCGLPAPVGRLVGGWVLVGVRACADSPPHTNASAPSSFLPLTWHPPSLPTHSHLHPLIWPGPEPVLAAMGQLERQLMCQAAVADMWAQTWDSKAAAADKAATGASAGNWAGCNTYLHMHVVQIIM